jgi:hypothetical protein
VDLGIVAPELERPHESIAVSSTPAKCKNKTAGSIYTFAKKQNVLSEGSFGAP